MHYSDDDIPAVEELLINADAALFSRVVGNGKHVLQHYLPDRSDKCNLRPPQHSKQLVELNSRDYIVWMLYIDSSYRVSS